MLSRTLLFILLTSLSSASAEPKNILFIAVDDLRPELGCYGIDHAQTPNLDRLASEGVLFENHFVAVPTCGASRYALLTGRSPANSGVTRSNAGFYNGTSALDPNQLAGAQTFPELFRRSGYETTLIGKMSHTADGKVFEYDGSGDGRPEVPHAWDHYRTPLGQWDRGWGVFFAYAEGKNREAKQPDRVSRDIAEFIVEKDSDLPDGQFAKEAVKFLKSVGQTPSSARKPFLLGLGFIKPHLPFVAPQSDWDAFDGIDIAPPPHPEKPEHSSYWHKSGEFFKYDFRAKGTQDFPGKEQPLPTESVAALRRAYLACIRYTDRQIGNVLDALDEQGLAENTVVVVWGDHGWNLGDSQMWAKHTPYERAVRSPLIIRADGFGSGKKSSALVETTDLYPTLIELCEPEFQVTSHPLDGKSLVPILKNPEANLREISFSYWGDAVTARSKKYRLIAKSKKDGTFDDIELYSIDQTMGDPVSNIADEHPEIVERLLSALP